MTMAAAPLIIVADRGSLKAFLVEETPTHGPAPRLVESFHIADAHQRYADTYSDQADAFPKGGTVGQGNAIGERLRLETEIQHRIYRQLAHQIASLIRQHQVERWAFAAPSEINAAILEELPPDLSARLDGNLKSDLTKIAPSELPNLFAGRES